MDPLQIAYGTIKSRLEIGAWSPGEKLPALAELARLCGVSRGTAWKAVSLLQKESLLHAKQRGKIVAGPPGVAQRETDPTKLLWKRIKARLGKEILSGAFSGQFFAPVSKLAPRYGVSSHTIKKVLEALVHDGLLAAEGRKYRQTRSESHLSQPPVVLISTGARNRGIYVTDPRTQAVVESYERECSRLNHACRSVGYNVYTTTALIDIKLVLRDLPETAGFIVNIWNPWNETQWMRWLDLLRLLINRKAPIIVLDQSGDLVFPQPLIRSPLFRVLRVASARAGGMIADFLFRKGHRKIAYVTPFFKSGWSQHRYEGLCAYAREYGGADHGIELFAQAELADMNDLRLALFNLDKRALKSLYRDSRTREQTDSLMDALDRINKTHLPREFRTDPATPTIRYLVRALIEHVNARHHVASCNAVLATIEHLTDEQAMQVYLRPFLSGVLKKSTSTAWVCSEDRTAINASLFLKSSGIKVPQEISVIGFDNWKEAYEQDVSAYDFNMDGMVKQALLMIMDKKTRRSMPVISEVDGYVVERGTTRR